MWARRQSVHYLGRAVLTSGHTWCVRVGKIEHGGRYTSIPAVDLFTSGDKLENLLRLAGISVALIRYADGKVFVTVDASCRRPRPEARRLLRVMRKHYARLYSTRVHWSWGKQQYN